MSTSSTAQKRQTLSFSDILPNQQAAIEAVYENNRLLVGAVGFGKAVVAQTAAQELLDDGELKRVLVIAPLKVALLTWGTEFEKWQHLEEPGMALGDAGERLWAHNDGARIVVLNAENVVWFFDTFGHDHGFDGLIVDEVTKGFKKPGGSRFKALRKHLKDFKWRLAMTATPVAESGQDIYAQCLVVDEGAALGTNLDRFRRRYMYPLDYQNRNWDWLPGGQGRMAEAAKNVVYVADSEEYEANLPPIRDNIINVPFSQDLQECYDEFAAEEMLEIGPVTVHAPNAAVVVNKLLQFTAGAIYDEDGFAHWMHWEKFFALDTVVEDADGPLMIAYQFQFELAELKARYPGIGVLGENPEEVMREWNAGRLPLMAAHPRSCAHGLNLAEGGNHLVVLTPPWSADDWRQLIGRLRRRGQHRDFVRRTIISAESGVDSLVLYYLMGKRQKEDVLMELFKTKKPA